MIRLVPALFGFGLATGVCGGVIHERESQYHYIRVVQEGSVRSLLFRRQGSSYRESAMDVDDPTRLVLGYTKLMFAGFLFNQAPKDMLMVGLGGGVCPRAMRQSFPDAHCDVIELDSAIVDVAKTYFGFKEDSALRVMVRDGRVGVKILKHRQRRYDVIMLDAFRAGYIPYHLTTKEFHEECRSLLKPGGVLVTNLWPTLMLYEYERRTLASVFAQQFAFSWGGNTIIVCLQTPSELGRAELQQRAVALNQKQRIPFPLTEVATRLDDDDSYVTKGQILTDDYAPANVLNSMPRD